MKTNKNLIVSTITENIPTIRFLDVSQIESQHLLERLARGGIREGAGRNITEMNEILELMPFGILAGKDAELKATEFIKDKDISHIIPYSHGGSNHAENLVFENSSANRARGAREISTNELEVIKEQNFNESLAAIQESVCSAAIDGLIFGAALGVGYACFEIGIAPKGEISKEEASKIIARNLIQGSCTGSLSRSISTAIFELMPALGEVVGFIMPPVRVLNWVVSISGFISRAYSKSQADSARYYAVSPEDLAIFKRRLQSLGKEGRKQEIISALDKINKDKDKISHYVSLDEKLLKCRQALNEESLQDGLEKVNRERLKVGNAIKLRQFIDNSSQKAYQDLTDRLEVLNTREVRLYQVFQLRNENIEKAKETNRQERQEELHQLDKEETRLKLLLSLISSSQ